MNSPGFSAEASVYTPGRRYQFSLSSAGDDRIEVVPAQVCCGTVSARCNGPFGSRATGFTSTTIVGGVANSCGGPFQFAFTNVCRDLSTGVITSRTNGCGFCLF